ncbi:hypothetical protein D3C71_582360 [compost metagenome]
MSGDQTYKIDHLASLAYPDSSGLGLSEQKIRVPIAIGIVTNHEQNEHKSNTKKLC